MFQLPYLFAIWSESTFDWVPMRYQWIPRTLAAAVILGLGIWLAWHVRRLISVSCGEHPNGRLQPWSDGAFTVVLSLTLLAALSQFGIRLGVVEPLLLIVVASVLLTSGLTVVICGREVISAILAGIYIRHRLRPGDIVQVAGYTGTIREVGSVATVIETEEDGMMQRHSIPNARMLREAVR